MARLKVALAGQPFENPPSHRPGDQIDLLTDQLETGDESFRALFESAPDAIFVENMSGEVLDVNPAACRLHGMGREELIGLNVTALVPPDARAEAAASFEAAAAGQIVRVEAHSLTKDGRSVPVSVSASRIYYRGQPALLVHVRDMTDQRLLEDQLRQSQKMEAIGRLAGGVAHDFNNLLTAILGYTELSASAVGEEHEIYKDLTEVRKAGEQAASLTRQLLAFSRQQVLEPKVKDLNEIVIDVENICRRTIGEDIRLVTRLEKDLKPVKIDEGQLQQVILNLVVNSRDAMPEGGEIAIETGTILVDEHFPSQGVRIEAGEYVSFSLRDTGCGMTSEIKQQVFDPFFTTKDPEKGTGLGLSTVYGIVKQSGGYIFIESQPDAGTTIRILLPPTEADPQVSVSSPAVSEESAGSKTILLTEDNKVVRELSTQVLEEMGYRVLAAETAEEGLRINQAFQEEIDLLVTDLVLTGMDGLTMTRELLTTSPGTRVLLMSGHTRRARFDPEPLLEGVAFLQKPFTPAGLKSAVISALRKPAPSLR